MKRLAKTECGIPLVAEGSLFFVYVPFLWIHGEYYNIFLRCHGMVILLEKNLPATCHLSRCEMMVDFVYYPRRAGRGGGAGAEDPAGTRTGRQGREPHSPLHPTPA